MAENEYPRKNGAISQFKSLVSENKVLSFISII